ncbi:hypothetical protein DY000_02028042 [Brassica cretica]|uniref:Uncharacterized protein n=1 Tax=Brassica cretica TaxID=69181 RepID=A0ABQ7EIF5_BRACR|nr:hypothetical protein DY000_02028042 [Brassica cretica]
MLSVAVLHSEGRVSGNGREGVTAVVVCKELRRWRSGPRSCSGGDSGPWSWRDGDGGPRS